MTTTSGEKVDFSHISIFMTSNLGMNIKSIGFKESEDVVLDKLKNFLGIELFNRISEVIKFNDLEEDDIRKIIKKKLTERVEKEKVKELLSTNIVDKIIRKSNYKDFGARKIDLLISEELKEMRQKNG